MKIVCISASNVQSAKETSASTRVCEMLRDQLTLRSDLPVEVRILRLVDYQLQPCIMCGECLRSGLCIYDQGFNEIYTELLEADGIFVVCPHYAPIPSKLAMLLEKIEELCYLAYCAKESFALLQKPVGLIVHGGGMGEAAEEHYRRGLLHQLAQVFLACGMRVVGSNESEPEGIVFGVAGMKQRSDSVLPEMVHDWNSIQNRLVPLAQAMMERLTGTE